MRLRIENKMSAAERSVFRLKYHQTDLLSMTLTSIKSDLPFFRFKLSSFRLIVDDEDVKINISMKKENKSR